MAQITIDLDDDVAALLNSASESAGVSKSRWIADAIRLHSRKEWPASVVALAGAWPDFPSATEIRANVQSDSPREEL